MLRIGIALLLGHCLIYACQPLPSAGIVLAGALSLVVLAALLRVPTAAAFAVGCLLAWQAGKAGLEDDLQPALEGEDVIVTGEIVSIPETTASGVQFDLELQARMQGSPRVARLSWYEAGQVPQPGEIWALTVRMKRRHGFANPGGFDYEGMLFRSGIGATGYVRASEHNRRLSIAADRGRLLRWRAQLADAIAQASHGDPLTGVLQGLAVGVQTGMSAAQWRVFARTGTTHLMAISGFHIGMVAAVLAWAAGVLCVRVCPQHWRITVFHGRALGGTAGALGYAALAGLSVPTQRTLVMLGLYLLARARRRPLAVSHALGLALICVLWVDPFAPLAPGAWLSFLAVGAILLVTLGRPRSARHTVEFARVQWAVTMGLLPVVITAFGGVSLVGPFANVLAIPVFTFLLVPLVLVGTAIAAISIPAGAVVLQLPLSILHALWRALEALAASDLALWHAPAAEPWALALCGLGAAGLLVPGIWPVRLAALSLCLPALINVPRSPAQGEAQFTVLDVGQGLSVVVRTQHHTLIYDTGPSFRSGRDTSELVVLPFLRARGIVHADVLMISHSDADHAGGLPTFLRDMPTRQVIHGPSLPARTGWQPCTAGRRWSWDGVLFEVLHPRRPSGWSDNDSSCVLRIATAGHAVLLTGDIERAAEAAVLPALRPVAVVVVPHHGSRTSSSEAFVAQTQAQHAFVSAGYRNRWGFPKQEVVQRWEASGARVSTTAETGAIEWLMSARGVEHVREYRREHSRFWSWHPRGPRPQGAR